MDSSMNVSSIKNKLDNIKFMMEVNSKNSADLKELYECFYLELHQYSKTHALNTELNGKTLTDLEKAAQDKLINDRFTYLTGKRLELVESFRAIIKDVKEVQEVVLNIHLNTWKNDQELAGIGFKPRGVISLDLIQMWCEQLAEIVWSTRHQIRQVMEHKEKLISEEVNVINYLPQLSNEIDILLANLIESNFIIENQPPQVVRTSTKFGATVRLLTGNILNVKQNQPKIKVSIVLGKYSI